jgi:hypothetical protein
LKQDANLMHIGYRLTTGPHTVVVAYNRLRRQACRNNDTNSYGVHLHLRTVQAHQPERRPDPLQQQGNGAQAAPGGNGFLGGVTSAAGVGSTNIALGIRHTF